VSFTRPELKSFTGATLPDLIADGAHASLDALAAAYREVALAAGVPIRSTEPNPSARPGPATASARS
jgi:hypothetical protein